MSTLEDKDDIRELLARYCFHFDAGEFEEWLQLFVADGVFDVAGVGRFAGRAALRTFLEQVPRREGRPMMKHYVTNAIVEVDGAQAQARSYVLVIGAGPPLQVTVAGRYDDELIRQADGWRFRERRALLDFVAGR